jgi:hypothetical protein
MVFNYTFSNMSVLFVEKPEYPEKTTDLPQVWRKPLNCHKALTTLSHVVSNILHHEWDSNSH